MGINLFANKSDFEAAQNKIASLEADLDASRNELDELKQSAITHAEAFTNLQNELAIEKSKNEELIASIESSSNEIAELKLKVDEAQQAAASKAAEILAAAGVPPVEVEANEGTPSIRDQYNKLTNPAERAAFRNKHWDALIKQTL